MSEREMVARAVREALGGCADAVTALALVEAPSTLALASTLEVTYDLATKLQAQVMTLLDEARALSTAESGPVAVPVPAPVPAPAKGQSSAQPSAAPTSRSPQQPQTPSQPQPQQQQQQQKREYPEDGPPDPALMAELAALAEQVGKSLPRIATQKQGMLTRNHYMKLARQQVAANRAR